MSDTDATTGTKQKDDRKRTSGKRIEISLIDPMPTRQRRVSSVDKSFVESLKMNGLLEPILVRPKPQGRFEVIGGERRLRGAREAKLTEVDCRVFENLTDEEAYKLALQDNMHENPNPMDLASYLLKIKTELHLAQKKIASMSGMSEEKLSNLLRVHDDQTLRKRVEGGLPISSAIELLKMKPSMDPEKWASFAGKTELSRKREIRELASEVKKHSQGKQNKVNSSRKLRCSLCRGPADILDLKSRRLCKRCVDALKKIEMASIRNQA
jgi:ParB/RepB/Spo0J family partition protein